MLIFLSSLRRLCQCLFDRPMLKTVCQPALVYPNNISPFGKTMCFSAKGDIDIMTRIALLFEPCGPTAIIWGVITIWVNAIKAVFQRRAGPHVFKKCLKIMHPSITYLDTAPSVIGKVLLSWICAASKHMLPARIGYAIDHPVSGVHLATQASATQRRATFERIIRNVFIVAASTLTIPMTRFGAAPNDSPATKGLPYKVLCFWGIIVHVGSLLSRLSATHLGVPAPQVHSISAILPQKRGKKRTYELPFWGRFEDVNNG